ncbi:hypothetical protein H1R20_g834, partial [Candolleomyces eurysporus]
MPGTYSEVKDPKGKTWNSISECTGTEAAPQYQPSTVNSDYEEPEEYEDQEDLPGDDLHDYDNVDLFNKNETANWPTICQAGPDNEQQKNIDGRSSDHGMSVRGSPYVSLIMNTHFSHLTIEIDNKPGHGREVSKILTKKRSAQAERQRKKQEEENLCWLASDNDHDVDINQNQNMVTLVVRKLDSVLNVVYRKLQDSYQGSNTSDHEDLDSEIESDADLNIGSLEIIQTGSGYLKLKDQPPRIQGLIHKAFQLAEARLCLDTPYPLPDQAPWVFREILWDAAKELKDKELVQHVKSNGRFGADLTSAVRSHFNRYRVKISKVAQTQAQIAYGLDSKLPNLECKAKALPSDDTFLYNVEPTTGWVLANEPYCHPAIIEAEDAVRSQEREIPIPMLAFAAAMLRAEIVLREKGRRTPLKFDADSHSGVFDSHLTILTNLSKRSLVKLHRLLAYLHQEGSKSNESKATSDENNSGTLRIMDLDGMED